MQSLPVWSVTLGCFVCLQEGAVKSHAMEMKGMWPYWKEGTDTQTVRNDVTLDRIVMLTGACLDAFFQ